MEEDRLTQIWKEYSQIKQYLNGKNYYQQLEINYNFAKGDQWKNFKSGGMPMPIDNIITPICNYKIGVVSQNNMTITFTDENFSKEDMEEIEDGTSFRDIAEEVIEKKIKLKEYNPLDDLYEEDATVSDYGMKINII